MKKLKTHYAIILLITAYFLFNGCLPRKSEIIVQYGQNEFRSWQLYAIDLQNEGYSIEASEKIAKTDYNIIPMDQEYNDLIED